MDFLLEWICENPVKPFKATASTKKSDNIRNYSPKNSIDNGSTFNNASDANHIFCSKTEKRPWLQLHFETNVTVRRVALTNRYDHNGHRFQNLTVSVGMIPAKKNKKSENPVCATYRGPSMMSSSITLNCSEPLTGIYVVVQQVTPEIKIPLSINEVFVCED